MRKGSSTGGVVTGALLLLALLAAGGSGRAAVGRFTPFGPERGAIRSMAVDPGAPGTIYGLSGPGQVFRSDDGGLSWRQAARGLESVGIAGLAADPLIPGRAFAASTSGRLFRTDDRGIFWRELSDTPAAVKSLAVLSSQTLYLLTTGGRLWQSRDGGESFAAVFETAGSLSRLLGDPTDERVAFLTVYDATAARRKVFRTTDGGLSWSLLPVPNAAADTAVLGVAATRPATVYIRSERALYASRDGGAAWERLGLGTVSEGAVLAVGPVARQTLYATAGAQRGLWWSADAGRSWTLQGQGLPSGQLRELAVDPDSRQVFALTEGGAVYRSETGGRRFQAGATRELLARSVGFLRFDPHDTESFYLQIQPAAVGEGAGSMWKSSDRGRSWRPFAGALTQAVRDVHDLVADPMRPGWLYAPTRAGLFRSQDGGTTWRALGIPARVAAIAGNGVLLAGDCGIERSENDGLTWGIALPCRSAGIDPDDPADDLEWRIDTLQVDPGRPETVFARLRKRAPGSSAPGAPSLFRSRDGGDSWQEAIFGDTRVAVAPRRPGTVYAAQADGLLLSEDGGTNWRRVGTQGLAAGLRELVVDPFRANVLYAVFEGRGVFRSVDSGATWESIHDGLPAVRLQPVQKLEVHPDLAGLLYASTTRGGLYGGRF